jgi:hypothetical protein
LGYRYDFLVEFIVFAEVLQVGYFEGEGFTVRFDFLDELGGGCDGFKRKIEDIGGVPLFWLSGVFRFAM